MTPCQKNEVRWKFHLHYHQMLILSQNETSIHEEYFCSCTFSYHDGFYKQKHAQTGSRYKINSVDLGRGFLLHEYGNER